MTELEAVGELLATIHGDGGHYQSKHGLDKAVEDAIKIIYDLRAEGLTDD